MWTPPSHSSGDCLFLMALAFAHQHSPQHQSPLLAHHHTNHMAGGGGGGGGGVNLQDWLKAWKAWAGTRKRGKMAQFIVQKLEENVSNHVVWNNFVSLYFGFEGMVFQGPGYV